MLRALAFLVLATAALAQPSLLDVRSATQQGPGGGASTDLTASFDLKMTIKLPFYVGGSLVSSGAGMTATFSAPAASRRAVLVRTHGAPYGIVKYDSSGGRFHVRHLVKGESARELAQVGQRVIDDWKAHYAASGIARGDMPVEWGPDVIRNSYTADPAGKVAFTIRGDGSVDPASVLDGTGEVSQKEEWRTNAWPAFAKSLGLLADSPLPGRDPARVPAQGGYQGADASQSLKSILAAARAMVPKHAGRITDVPFPAVVPAFTVSGSGERVRLVGQAANIQLNKDAKLLSYRREVTFDSVSKTVRSDSVHVVLDIKGNRTEARVSWMQ